MVFRCSLIDDFLNKNIGKCGSCTKFWMMFGRIEPLPACSVFTRTGHRLMLALIRRSSVVIDSTSLCLWWPCHCIRVNFIVSQRFSFLVVLKHLFDFTISFPLFIRFWYFFPKTFFSLLIMAFLRLIEIHVVNFD